MNIRLNGFRLAKPLVRTVEDARGKLRRFLMCHLEPQKVRTSIERRRGRCTRCAQCCKIIFRCPLLVGNTCLIYHKRLEQCGVFPIDARDLASVDGQCGFYFEK